MSIATTEPAPNGQAQVPAQSGPPRILVRDSSQFANLLDSGRFEHMYRLSKLFASSTLVPDQFKGNASNCFIAIQMAVRLGVDPFMFLQNCYVVHGRPGIEAKLAIALANSSGVFRGPIRYKLSGEGNSRQCTAYAVDADTDETLEMTVTWAMVEAEGWNKKAGSKWLTIPDLMFHYRSAMFLIKAYHPEVLMGMHSKEELDDMPGEDVRPARAQATSNLDSLTDRLLDDGQSSLEQAETAAEEQAEDAKEATSDEAASETAAENAAPSRIDLFRDLCENAETWQQVLDAHEQLGELPAEERTIAEACKNAAAARINKAKGGKPKQGTMV